MNILAIDTAAGRCAACGWRSPGGEAGRKVIELPKGHAEALMGVIGDALTEASLTLPDIGLVAVSIGPGSFTGVRIGVATARGLALALKVPSLGVSTLDAIAYEAQAARPGRAVLVAIDGGRGEAFVAGFDANGMQTLAPVAMTFDEAATLAREGDLVLAGSGARALADRVDRNPDVVAEASSGEIASFAALAEREWRVRGAASAAIPARPLYLRAADARPQSGFALPRRAV